MKRDRLHVLIVSLVLLLMVGAVPVMGQEPVTITVATRPEAAPGDRFIGWTQLAEELIEVFEARHPHIKVEFEPLVGGWGERITVGIASGTAPDVFEMWGANATDWGERGFLLDLNPFVERDRDDVDPDDFFPGDYAAGIVQYGEYAGQRFSLPRYTNASVIFFNQSYFDEAGIATPADLAEQEAWTWDALREAAQRLTRRDANRVTRYGYRTFFGDARFAPWIWGAGGQLFDGPLEVAFDRPQALEGLDYIHSLIWELEVATFGGAWEGGAVAFREQGSKDMGPYGNVIGSSFEWDIAPLPVGPAGERGSWVAGDMWGISASTPHPEEAWEFLKFLTSPEAMAIMTRRTGLPGSRFSTFDALRDAYGDRSVANHLLSASTARVLPFSSTVRAADVARIFDGTIRLSLETNELPIASAVQQAAGQVRALYNELD